MILPAVLKGLKSAGKHVLNSVVNGEENSQADSVIMNAINSHPKAKNHSLSKAAKLDIVRNAVNEAIIAPAPVSGDVKMGGNHASIIQGNDNSVANESTLSNQFGMSNLKKSDPFAEFASDAVSIKGVEYLGSVIVPDTSAQGSTIFTLSFNPLKWYNTRLAKYASLFNYYRFIKVEIVYEPIVSKMTPGSLCAAILPNVARQVPGSGVDGLRSTMELKNSIMFPVYQVQTLTYKFSTPTQPLLCVPGSNPVNDLQRTLTDQGTLFFKDAVGTMSNGAVGQVVVKYEISLYDSCIGAVPANPITSNFTLAFRSDANNRLDVNTAGWIPAADYTRFYYMTPLADLPSAGLYALRTYVIVVAATSTGQYSKIYQTLQDALVGPQAGLVATLGGPTTGIVVGLDAVTASIVTLAGKALPAYTSLQDVKPVSTQASAQVKPNYYG